jgi:cobalt-zinc-cadmium efflux system membrane fusion protein
MKYITVCALGLVTLWSACPSSPSSSPSSPTHTENAPKDWCGEHGVPESRCTRCHPELAARFRAEGDWCDEHGFPESVCPTCHPRQERIDVDAGGSAKGALADGFVVTWTDPGVVATAGIATVPATRRAVGPALRAVARVVYDAARVSHVNARAPGVVREVRVDVGSRVARGAVLAIVDSAVVGEDRGRLATARARLRAAEAAVGRQTALFEQGIAPRRSVDEAVFERDAAHAAVETAQAALGTVGSVVAAAADDAAAWRGGAYELTAPLAGVVVRRDVAVGEAVTPGPVLFEVVDASRLWAELEIPERDLARARRGMPATLTVDALPGRTFAGRVEYIAPELDPRTRTARGRVALGNDDGALRANMFGRAALAFDAETTVVVVPAQAVQRVGEEAFVFVRRAPTTFVARRVTVGDDDGEIVELTGGVDAGADVVTTGSFLLKSEALKASLGDACSD